jgi:hypothetical protein
LGKDVKGELEDETEMERIIRGTRANKHEVRRIKY